jgi:hypothetical protein
LIGVLTGALDYLYTDGEVTDSSLEDIKDSIKKLQDRVSTITEDIS